MKFAAAIRHVHFEDLGAFAATLGERGYQIRYYEAGVDNLRSPELAAADLLVVLGGPIGAYEEDKYPFLRDELAVIDERLAANRPALGICLGAQLFARALGSRVYPGPAKEIGWAPVTLTSAGENAVTKSLAGGPVLHWHGDTCDLPHGAELLASTSICRNQAFTVGTNTLAFQFHPEAISAGFERWLIGHAAEISSVGGLSVSALRADTQRFAPAACARGQQCFADWLAQLDGVTAAVST
jgi:GMP synthase (glutamine-hydrolysing)